MGETEPDVSIVIVRYGRPPSWSEYAGPRRVEILVRDNTHENIGFARGVDLLLPRARGRYIVLLNPDAIPRGDWLERLIEAAESDPRIGIVQPKLLKSNGLLDSTGHEPDPANLFRDRGEWQEDRGQYDRMRELPSATFACVLIKREVFASIGDLDSKMFLYCEDVDFCLRAKRAGWRIVYEPAAVVIHDRGSRKYPEAQVNLLRVYIKNGMWKKIFQWYPSRFLGIIAGVKNRDLEYAKGRALALIRSFR